MIRTSAILFISTSIASAAAPDVCRPYATATTQAAMNYLWLRSYTSCLNQDETPIPPQDWRDALRIILPDDPPTTDRSTVDTTPANDKSPIEPTIHWLSPAEICARAHRRIVWHGKSWRCQ